MVAECLVDACEARGSQQFACFLEKNDTVAEHDKHLGNSSERVIIGGENESYQVQQSNKLSNELLQKFEGKTREVISENIFQLYVLTIEFQDLIFTLYTTQNDLEKQKKKLKDLEDYLDDLLLRVMETTPRILQNPYVTCKMAHKKYRYIF